MTTSDRPLGNDQDPVSGWAFVAAGIFLAVVGVGAFALGDGDGADMIGTAALAAAGLVASIGAIAVGVTIGVRRARLL